MEAALLKCGYCGREETDAAVCAHCGNELTVEVADSNGEAKLPPLRTITQQRIACAAASAIYVGAIFGGIALRSYQQKPVGIAQVFLDIGFPAALCVWLLLASTGFTAVSRNEDANLKWRQKWGKAASLVGLVGVLYFIGYFLRG